MARRSITPGDRERRTRIVPGDWTQGQYLHPGAYTADHRLLTDASARYIAIPQAASVYGNITYSGRPLAARVVRADEWYLRMDTMADTRYAGKFQAGVEYLFAVHPDVNTLSWVAVTNTGYLNLNWGWE